MHRVLFWVSFAIWVAASWFDASDFRHDHLQQLATYVLIGAVYVRIGSLKPLYAANYTISVSRDTPMPARSFGEP